MDVPSNKSWIYPSATQKEKDRLRAELERLQERVRELEEAAQPFAEKPHDGMNDYPCHTGIYDDPEKCGRCGRAIRLWKALANSEKEPDHDR